VHARCENGIAEACHNFELHCTETCGE
jgi:hypothetical protein